MSPLRKRDVGAGEKFRVTLDCVPSRHTPWRRSRDQREIFLRDLRGLRARRGLGLDEMAVRTGFPADEHAATETGPGLPSLPALEAYLRGCGEPLAIWEDRWRRLTQGSPAALGDLPAREPGTSPLATAGAALASPAATSPAMAVSGESTVPAQPTSTIKRHASTGRVWRHPAFSRRYAVAALGAVVALITVGAIVFQSSSGAGRNHLAVAPKASPRGVPPLRRAAPQLRHGHSASSRSGGQLDVAGVGCPEDNDVAVVLANAPAGPRWTAAGGGWTGNGCDGRAVWTFNPNGNQPVPSTLTWKFVPAGGTSRCTLAVFVPEQNALGVSEYQIFSAAPAASRMIATVRVWQGATAGQWVRLGSYLISGAFEIRLMPDMSPFAEPDPSTHGRHHVAQAPGYNAAIAASAASATCS